MNLFLRTQSVVVSKIRIQYYNLGEDVNDTCSMLNRFL